MLLILRFFFSIAFVVGGKKKKENRIQHKTNGAFQIMKANYLLEIKNQNRNFVLIRQQLTGSNMDNDNDGNLRGRRASVMIVDCGRSAHFLTLAQIQH